MKQIHEQYSRLHKRKSHHLKFGFTGNYENIIPNLETKIFHMVWLKQNVLNDIDQEIKASKIDHFKRLEGLKKDLLEGEIENRE